MTGHTAPYQHTHTYTMNTRTRSLALSEERSRAARTHTQKWGRNLTATLLETVLEPPGQVLDIPAAASAGCPATLSLGRPVVCRDRTTRVDQGGHAGSTGSSTPHTVYKTTLTHTHVGEVCGIGAAVCPGICRMRAADSPTHTRRGAVKP